MQVVEYKDGEIKKHPDVFTEIQGQETEKCFTFSADFYKKGFPTTPKLDECLITYKSSTTSLDVKKRSLFAQQFHSFKDENKLGKKNIVQSRSSQESFDIQKREQPTCPIKNLEIEQLHQSVHNENLQRLHHMDEEEILVEKSKLLSTLDQNVMSFLQSKPKSVQSSILEQESSSKLTKKLLGSTCKDGFVFKESYHSEATGEKDLTATETLKLNPYYEFCIRKENFHMAGIENNKLAWMKKIPYHTEESLVPRFDFNGKLMSHDVEIQLSTGLYHHGEEPGLPGYTLEELVCMARSNLQAQRIMALKILGRILLKYQQQEYCGRFSSDLLTQCINAGLVFILRWALDEQSEQIYSASIVALANMVYVGKDQDAVENYAYSEEGYKVPSLCLFYKKKTAEMTQEEKEQNRDLTDAEIMQEDVIKGLIQVQTLPRLRYIMEVCEASDTCLENCLFILIRVTVHNKEAAHEICKTPRMIDVIFTFLEKRTNKRWRALQLIKFICTAEKHLAIALVAHFNLDGILATIFTSISSAQSCDTLQLQTFTQVCQIWRLLLMYGLCTHLVRDLYATMMNHMQQMCASYQEFDDKFLASVVLVIDAAFYNFSKSGFDIVLIDGLNVVILCMFKTVQKDMYELKTVKKPYFISSLLRCCSSYFYAKNSMVLQINPISLLTEAEIFWKDYIHPMLSSSFLKNVLDELRLYSDFKPIKEIQNEMQYSPPCSLPNYGTYCIPGSEMLSLKTTSPIMLVQAILKLVLRLMQIDKTLVPQVINIIMMSESISYVKSIDESCHLKRCHILITTHMELLILSHLIDIFHFVGERLGYSMFEDAVVNMYQRITFRLLCLFNPGDEHLADRIVKNVIFNPKMFGSQKYLLSLAEHCTINNKNNLNCYLINAKSDLQHIGNMYEEVVFKAEIFQVRKGHSFMTASRRDKLVPSDWMFLPIVNLYHASLKTVAPGESVFNATNKTVDTLKRCLQFILLLEVTHPSLLVDVDETFRLTRFMCFFLSEGNLFKEDDLKQLLYCLLTLYSSPSFQLQLNLDTKIPGICSFYDMYCMLLEQYLSSSFTDNMFANLLLFPMQLRHNVKFRRAVWTEHCVICRIFPLPLNQVTCDIKNFLADEQENYQMVQLYFKALIGRKVRYEWCPMFYLIAVHHVNQFIYNYHRDVTNLLGDERGDYEECREQFLIQLLHTANQELKDDILTYECFDITCSKGMSKFKELPPSRQILLRDHITSG